MNLYYAMGGGLGHLTRARAFLHTLNIENHTVILTSSQFSKDKRITDNIKVIRVDNNLEKDVYCFQKFLSQTFNELKISRLFLDSFPLGIIGELADFDFGEIEVNYVARLLRWNVYSPFIKKIFPKFERTFILEQLDKEHLNFINQTAKQQIKLELKYPISRLSEKDEKTFQNILKNQKPFWLIVHSGNEEEISELVKYAEEMREIEKAKVNLVLITPQKIKCNHLFQADIYPASLLFKEAERIFTACGFNAMYQLKNFAKKHYFIPFERRFDDQFTRAKLLKQKNRFFGV